MAVSNHFSNYTPLHCASHGALVGFGRMLRWAKGWLGQEAGVRTGGRGRGRQEDGTQRPGDHTSLSLLPRASWGPGPYTGEFPGAQTQLLTLAGFSTATSSHRRAMGPPSPSLRHGQRNIRVSEVGQNSEAQPGHNLFVSSVLPLCLPIYLFI